LNIKTDIKQTVGTSVASCHVYLFSRSFETDKDQRFICPQSDGANCRSIESKIFSVERFTIERLK